MRARLRTCFGVLAIAVSVVIAAAGASWAYFATTGSSIASANVGALSAPAIASANAGAGTVALSWNAVTPPAGGTVSYYVTRNGGVPAGNCPTSTSPASVTSCTDSGLAAGTYHYTVTAVWQSWTATSATQNVTLSSGALAKFVVSAPATATAGTGFTATITAEDSSGNTVTSYAGSQAISISGLSPSPNSTRPGYPATVNFSAGVGSATVTPVDAQTSSLAATQGAVTGISGSIAVSPAGASSFTVANPGGQTAGTAFGDTITALDSYGNTATGYTGSQALTFSGPASSPNPTLPSYPASVSFNAGVGTGSPAHAL